MTRSTHTLWAVLWGGQREYISAHETLAAAAAAARRYRMHYAQDFWGFPIRYEISKEAPPPAGESHEQLAAAGLA